MNVVEESIYDHPKYYDLVFGADCAAEVNFVTECARAYLGRPMRRVFEPACGTGRLLFWLAKRGYDVSGLDLNEKAIAYCNARLTRHGFPPSAWVADMCGFGARRRSDLAMNTINSFRHVGSESAARAHLDCMAEAIRPGGLYLLGVHLTPHSGTTERNRIVGGAAGAPFGQHAHVDRRAGPPPTRRAVRDSL